MILEDSKALPEGSNLWQWNLRHYASHCGASCWLRFADSPPGTQKAVQPLNEIISFILYSETHANIMPVHDRCHKRLPLPQVYLIYMSVGFAHRSFVTYLHKVWSPDTTANQQHEHPLQIFGPHPRPTYSETLEWGPAICVLMPSR